MLGQARPRAFRPLELKFLTTIVYASLSARYFLDAPGRSQISRHLFTLASSQGVRVGPHCFIGRGASIAAGCVIGAFRCPSRHNLKIATFLDALLPLSSVWNGAVRRLTRLWKKTRRRARGENIRRNLPGCWLPRPRRRNPRCARSPFAPASQLSLPVVRTFGPSSVAHWCLRGWVQAATTQARPGSGPPTSSGTTPWWARSVRCGLAARGVSALNFTTAAVQVPLSTFALNGGRWSDLAGCAPAHEGTATYRLWWLVQVGT